MEQDPDLDAVRQTEGYQKLLSRRAEVERRRGELIEAKLKAESGKDYLCEIDHDRKLVFATNIDQRTLDEVKANLTAEATALWADIFDYKPAQYLTIIIPSEKDAAKMSPMVGGYFAPESDRLVARQIGVTLRHEFTHAMHWGDQLARGQEHVIWVLEGMAGLVESATFKGGHIHPEPSTRLNILQALIRRKQEMPWKTLFATTPPQFMHSAQITYPETRYIMMYLFQKGKLHLWYETYCRNYDDDPTGVKATEKVFGKKLADIEADWKKWVMSLTPPPTHEQGLDGRPGHQRPDGLKIARIMDGGGARTPACRKAT